MWGKFNGNQPFVVHCISTMKGYAPITATFTPNFHGLVKDISQFNPEKTVETISSVSF